MPSGETDIDQREGAVVFFGGSLAKRGERLIHVAKLSPVSTGKLSALLRLHTRPINLVVFQGAFGTNPYEASSWRGLRA